MRTRRHPGAAPRPVGWASRRRLVVAVAATALAVAGATTGLGLAGRPAALLTGTFFAAATALVGGWALVRRRDAAGRRDGFRLAGGCAAAVYGAGQLLLGVELVASGGALTFPSTGDLVTLGAAPAALVTVLLLPRPAGPTGRLAQLLPDALAVATAGALLIWRSAFLDSAAGGPDAFFAALVVVAQLGVVALVLQVAVIGLDRGTAVFGVGAALLATADIATVEASMEGSVGPPWVTAVLQCLAWPLLCGGLALARARTHDVDETGQVRAEARTAVSTTGLLLVAAAALAVVLRGGEPDPVSSALVAALVVLLALRELLQQRRRVRQVAALSHLAHHDPLTGLGNRRALEAALRRLTADPGPASALVLDLDGFKEVNDRLGHATGDALLVAVARALREFAPAGVEAFRTGGDEFALLGPLDAQRMVALAVRVSTAVHGAAASVPGVHQVRLSASCGVVGLRSREVRSADADGGEPELLAAVSEAGAAMEAAKRAGRDRVVLYSAEVAAAARREAAVRRRLRPAIERDQLVVHLQPVVEVATGALHGFEALSRWSDDELGEVSPVEFVPAAEQSGLVVELGRSVLRQGLRALVTSGGVDERLTLAVNASPVELRSTGFVADVRAALEEHGVPADLLVVEVTEAVLVTDDDPAVRALAALSALGVTVAVDDFGTGYSSLAYLTRMPVHVLKLDRSLTSALADPASRAVVEAVVRMSRALSLDVVAEGVEEDAQALALAELGVRYGQGWLWSPAVPPQRAAAMVAQGAAGGVLRRPALVDSPP